MTNIKPLDKFIGDDLPYLRDQKDNPDEWYVLIGKMVGEYSVWADVDVPDDYEEHQEDLPPEERDANPNVEGHVQVGSAGWTSDAFDFGDSGFVQAFSFGDKVDGCLLNILLAHESVLSDEALEVANGEPEQSDGGESA